MSLARFVPWSARWKVCCICCAELEARQGGRWWRHSGSPWKCQKARCSHMSGRQLSSFTLSFGILVKLGRALLPGSYCLSGTGPGGRHPAPFFSSCRPRGGQGRAAHRESRDTWSHWNPAKMDRQSWKVSANITTLERRGKGLFFTEQKVKYVMLSRTAQLRNPDSWNCPRDKKQILMQLCDSVIKLLSPTIVQFLHTAEI